MSVSLITAPAAEPIAVAEVRAQLQLDTNDFDDYLLGLITTARQWAEKYTNRSFVTQTWAFKADYFYPDDVYGSIYLPKPPLISVSSITYVDTFGDTQTFSSAKYTVDTSGVMGRVYPVYNETWPATQCIPNAVNVTYQAGYGNQDDIKEDIKHALKIIVSEMFRNREGTALGRTVVELPFQYRSLLDHYRVSCFG